jgi:hypothetical protein
VEPSVVERRDERGESLVEVLAALAVLLLVMVGVLQLFSLAVLSYRVAAAQTEMTNKAESVVEVIRMVSSTGTGSILPLTAGSTNLPYGPAAAANTFWGPSGFGIVEPNAPYRITYEVTDSGADWLVTVYVHSASQLDSTGTYLGPVGQKGIRYAARIPK